MAVGAVVKFSEFFRIGHFYYKLVGVPPFFKESKVSLTFSIVFWSSFFNLLSANIAEYLYLFVALVRSENFLNLIALIPCLCFVALALNAMLVVARKRHSFIHLIENLKELFITDATEQRLYKVSELKKKFEKLLTIYSAIFLVLIATFNFIPFVMALREYICCGVFTKSLPYLTWYPFDEFSNQYFPYVYLHHSWGGFTCIFAMLAEIFFIGSTVLQICLQFRIVSKKIVDFVPRSREDSAKFLCEIVKQHNVILKNAKEFADLISGTLFLHQTCSSITICCVGFQVAMGEDLATKIKYIQFLFCALMQAMLISFFGNQFIEDSSNIATAAYESNWLEGDTKYRKGLLLIMIRASKPEILMGLNYTAVSVRGLAKILSSSYSYFALIRKMYSSM